MIKEFSLYWLTGKKERVTGYDIADAMTRAGYSSGALRGLDFYAPGNNENYIWNGKIIRSYGRGAADALNKCHISIVDVYRIYPVIRRGAK